MNALQTTLRYINGGELRRADLVWIGVAIGFAAGVVITNAIWLYPRL